MAGSSAQTAVLLMPPAGKQLVHEARGRGREPATESAFEAAFPEFLRKAVDVLVTATTNPPAGPPPAVGIAFSASPAVSVTGQESKGLNLISERLIADKQAVPLSQPEPQEVPQPAPSSAEPAAWTASTESAEFTALVEAPAVTGSIESAEFNALLEATAAPESTGSAGPVELAESTGSSTESSDTTAAAGSSDQSKEPAAAPVTFAGADLFDFLKSRLGLTFSDIEETPEVTQQAQGSADSPKTADSEAALLAKQAVQAQEQTAFLLTTASLPAKENADGGEPKFPATSGFPFSPAGTAQPEAAPVPLAANAPVPHVDSLVDQIVQGVRFAQHAETSELQVHLKPEFLGKLSIRVLSDLHGVRMEIKAENEVVRQIMQDNMANLQQRLADKGILLDHLALLADTGSAPRRNQEKVLRPLSSSLQHLREAKVEAAPPGAPAVVSLIDYVA